MTEDEEAIKDFLAARDLALLSSNSLVFAKSREFIRSEHSFALKWFMVLGCVPCLAPIATFKFERLFDHFSVELNNESVVVTAPVNWFCSVTVEKTRLQLTSIVDVTLDDDKFCSPYGLKQMNIWAYGDTEKTGASVSVSWVANPELARQAILLAVSLRKAAAGLVPLGPLPVSDDLKATPTTTTTTTTAVEATVAAATAPTAASPEQPANGVPATAGNAAVGRVAAKQAVAG